jgi:pimeloyl-ACP methyl ester carboxylesterase
MQSADRLNRATVLMVGYGATQVDRLCLAGLLPECHVVWLSPMSAALVDARSFIVAALDANPTSVHLVGYGVGGAMALEAACVRPSSVTSLALIDPRADYLLGSMGPMGRTVLQDPAHQPAPWRPVGQRMSLAILRRMAIPTLVVETSKAGRAAKLVSRRLHAIGRRSHYALTEEQGAAETERHSAASAIAVHIKRRMQPGEDSQALAA